MSFLGGLIAGAEGRSVTLESPGDMLEVFTGGSTYTGQKVSPKTALRHPAILDCVVLISSSVGGMPLVVYRRNGDDKNRDSKHSAWRLLHDQPNPEMAADEVWEITLSHLLLWGNAYLAKVRDSLGIVRELWPISPSRVKVMRDDAKRKVFVIDGQPYTSTDILHFRGLSSDGLVGYSPIQLARQSVGIAAAQEEFQGKFLGGGGKPSVILRHPQTLSPDAAKRLKASWDAIRSGGTAVLEEGIEVEQWTMPLADAQFIDQQAYTDLQIARMFQVPPGKIGAKSGDSLTYSTNEMNGIDLVTYTFGRWMKRIEGGLLTDPAIFPRSAGMASSHFAEFLSDGLLRTDIKSRYQSYLIGINAGFLTINEVRQMENRPALEVADLKSSEPSKEI